MIKCAEIQYNAIRFDNTFPICHFNLDEISVHTCIHLPIFLLFQGLDKSILHGIAVEVVGRLAL